MQRSVVSKPHGSLIYPDAIKSWIIHDNSSTVELKWFVYFTKKILKNLKKKDGK